MLLPFTPPAVHTAGVVVEKTTERPLDALALTVMGDCEVFLVPMAANVIA